MKIIIDRIIEEGKELRRKRREGGGNGEKRRKVVSL